MSRRFQFSLKWLFVAMLAVACWFGGMRLERSWFHDRIVSQGFHMGPLTLTEFADGRRFIAVGYYDGDFMVAEYDPADDHIHWLTAEEARMLGFPSPSVVAPLSASHDE
jgi:hypothetical protein